jgi:NADH:ubiquinone oxidoreductase subunit F (NADH-binding)/NADH:ubiquinone oxidoreductase subunit E
MYAMSHKAKVNSIPSPVKAEVLGLAQRYNRSPESILDIFRALQKRHGGLSREAIESAAHALGIPAERAYGVATFYSLLDVLPGASPRPGGVIRVCDGPACWLCGAAKARTELEGEFGREWRIERTSCLGLCDRAPAALIDDRQCGPLLSATKLVEKSQWMGEARAYARPHENELRVLLARAGKIDPDSLESALELGAYQALQKALQYPPNWAINEIEAAGLMGRGGAGFPAGRKWRFVAQEAAIPKYVVCNADESEPLVFKDRALIDSDPHQLLEGMALAGWAIGASEGYIYIRGEYGPQADRLERAIAQAEEHGWLGTRIRTVGETYRHTPFSFRIHVHRGAGAYICGEETALLESLEGKRGEPRTRPPYPTTHGYRGQPTLVNNVETLSAVPSIIAHGAKWYRALGAVGAPGTKLYTLLGHVNRPGLFEAPFKLTLREIIEDFGGGMRFGSVFGFALTGGAAGTIVPPSLLDMPIDYASAAQGVSLGAGAFLICDESVSPVALLRELLHFFEVESCGKCTPCRIGTHEARVILDRLVAGQGRAGEVERLAGLAEVLQSASFCGLGQSAAMPMKTALTHFADAFQAMEH